MLCLSYFSKGFISGSQMNTICSNCGHQNRAGTLICDKCGTMLEELVKARETNQTIQFVESPSNDSGNDQSPDALVLTVKRAVGQPPFILDNRNREYFVGRSDASVTADIDLGLFNGVNYGVSRRHARIFFAENAWMVEDLGSTNGSYLNRHRINQGTQRIIQNGDELVFGKMIVLAYFTNDDFA